ncbi:4-hydroxy-tetrahydrodipicolinate reductase [Nanchangia anserum]|uniref:4-hydroxy-tetrahydrodipicolinate reductase n=1 Tax=Nanchangia anserum TaxID=2692125 RepID=A0A8I0KPE6_9ACTO|nr:4-hydroxy-tetrahydrodipicolinate reductase [Nanchangia anserum]MBD3690276.1 4-hydroxy-tetrahydrodipicolinate reductase [Nanchangia anserum]QOX82286.1 4-hydroxy-tetrahydrodipicolinate reductase [Nanchangia anserum]
MIRVAVIGAAGRMGQTACQAVEAVDDMTLVARLDADDAIDADHLCGADVAVEFTIPAHTEANVHALLDAGVAPVVGTTGWDDAALERVREHACASGVNALIAPNFAISAVLVMEFARQAARYFTSAEVIEMHHPNKLDAPSGTAAQTAQLIAQARRDAGAAPMPDATQMDPDGCRGGMVAGVPVHAVRLAGLNAHEEVLFGNTGEQLVLRSDCFDRSSFMPGVLAAVRAVRNRPGLTHGLAPVLGLEH